VDRRFEAKQSTILRDLEIVMEKMEAEQHQIVRTGSSAVAIVFIRRDGDGARREYRFDCDTWDNAMDNLRAAQQAITYLYRIFNEYGVGSVDKNLAGYRVLPGSTLLLKDAFDPYHELGIPPSATLDEARRQYHRLATRTHPDVGGNREDFQRITEAFRLIEAQAKEKSGGLGSGA